MEGNIGSLSGEKKEFTGRKSSALCSKITSHAGKLMLQDILKPINARAEHKEVRTAILEQFVENVYIPVFQGGKWKDSTADTEIPQIRFHSIRAFGGTMLRNITDEALQAFLNEAAKSCGRNVIDHLRFRLRSIFKLAMARGVVDRNSATVLFTPRECRPCREKKVLKPSDLFAMLEAPDGREQLITRLATWEGMRPGDSENGTPLRRDNIWRRYMLPKLEPIGLEWATFQVMRRTWASWSKKVGVDAQTRSAQMENTVDVNENEDAVASFEQKLAAVRLLKQPFFRMAQGALDEAV